MRNLVDKSYRKAGVIGNGIPLESDQLNYGIEELNLILDDVYSQGKGLATLTVPVVFDGKQNYTVGPQPENGGDVPDIELPLMPISIDQIILQTDGSRYTVINIDPLTYASRNLDTLNTIYPDFFFFERTNPLGTIKFYEGSPSGPGEIIYKPSMVDVNAKRPKKSIAKGSTMV